MTISYIRKHRYLSGEMLAHLSHAPAALSAAPTMQQSRSPRLSRSQVAGKMRGI